MKKKLNIQLLGALISVLVLSSGLMMAYMPTVSASGPGGGPPYLVMTEQGLPQGWNWSVYFVGFNSIGGVIYSASLAPGVDYNWLSIAGLHSVSVGVWANPVSSYAISVLQNYSYVPLQGSYFRASNNTVFSNDVYFHVTFVRGYDVSFSAIDAGNTTTWGIAVARTGANYLAAPLSYLSGRGVEGMYLANGTYVYTTYVKTNSTGQKVNGASGTFTVDGHPQSIDIYLTSNAYQVIVHDTQTIMKWVEQNWETTVAIGIVFVIAGYFVSIVLPSREELRKDLGRHEKRRSRK